MLNFPENVFDYKSRTAYSLANHVCQLGRRDELSPNIDSPEICVERCKLFLMKVE